MNLYAKVYGSGKTQEYSSQCNLGFENYTGRARSQNV